MRLQYIDNGLTTLMFMNFRNTVGWKYTTRVQARIALKHTLFSVVAFCNDQPVGMGRLIGDGAIVWYIQDLIVFPKYQDQNIRSAIMRRLIDHVKENSTEKSRIMISVSSSPDDEAFYQEFGFSPGQPETEGIGMKMYYDT